jgi:hypothetical protein
MLVAIVLVQLPATNAARFRIELAVHPRTKPMTEPSSIITQVERAGLPRSRAWLGKESGKSTRIVPAHLHPPFSLTCCFPERKLTPVLRSGVPISSRSAPISGRRQPKSDRRSGTWLQAAAG